MISNTMYNPVLLHIVSYTRGGKFSSERSPLLCRFLDFTITLYYKRCYLRMYVQYPCIPPSLDNGLLFTHTYT